ncbi:serine/threonine protein kinase [Cellulomonas sp. DKR-3]|uniref:non-specific serine/threonine protein kinase n=1 Tax=Cellulomonas fulva TaxID=2835530 RepID=A0ABS5TWE1_9CELL|nr:serine/threonine-protein kinase [Cellulomonas fulva]MBT0993460.1 serine/threonine protein kinase [Cellulomonas fulva]
MRTAQGVALGGRYRLVRQIAVGGMGEVWEAYDESLARSVAVKVLKAEFAGDAGFLERFRTEARNSAALSHANIAQLFDYGEQEGSGYLVIELVPGEPLSDLLEREPVLPVRRLLPILAQTARGLHAAHRAGVVHRDVKPGNILLGRGSRVKITDFGVSLAHNQMTMTATGMVMGTAQYLSPEQAVGKPATPLSDLYSLGIIAYEALVGHRPFTGPTAVDIAVAHVNNPVPPLPAAVDPRLADLVVRLLSKDPAARPASGAELAAELDRLVPRTPPAGVPVVVTVPDEPPARPVPAPPSSSSPSSSSPSPSGPPAVPPPPGSGPSTTRPPSYPPRRDLRSDATPSRPPRTASSGSPLQGSGPRLGPLGRMSWPLVALVLLLVALLGAALAGQLTKADGSPVSPPLARIVTWTSGSGALPDAMIGQDVPRDPSVLGTSTEVKDT